MPRISLAGFKDPVRRPRFIIWTGVVVLAVIVFLVFAIGVSSSRWFCGGFCHSVQGDAIKAYERSTHSEISCLACHMPVNADPVTFLFHKAKNGVNGVIGVTTGKFEVPLNAESHLAMNTTDMPERQCTQCHTSNRKLTPHEGIIIDHAVHSKNGVTCTMCHNRVGHPEKGLTLAKGSHPKEDFMKMEGCFRCHALPGQKPSLAFKAPGDCGVCHPTGFELKPANHLKAGFYQKYGDSAGHAKLAKADTKGTYCSMCHVKTTFCTGCHGVEMPHPKDFIKTHGPTGKKTPAVCANCHAKGAATAAGTEFCNACHHKEGDPSKPWIPQHFVVVAQSGANACFECHNPTFCAHCHVQGLGK